MNTISSLKEQIFHLENSLRLARKCLEIERAKTSAHDKFLGDEVMCEKIDYQIKNFQGKRMTATELARAAGYKPTRSNILKVSAYLKAKGYECRRTGEGRFFHL